MTPLLLQLAAVGQRKDLKAARIGQHRSVPCREAVDAARLFENFHSRTQVKVVGIGQNDLGLRFVAHVAMEDPLDCRRGSDRHEDRRADHAVVGRNLPCAGFGAGIGMSERKLHHNRREATFHAPAFSIRSFVPDRCRSRPEAAFTDPAPRFPSSEATSVRPSDEAVKIRPSAHRAV